MRKFAGVLLMMSFYGHAQFFETEILAEKTQDHSFFQQPTPEAPEQNQSFLIPGGPGDIPAQVPIDQAWVWLAIAGVLVGTYSLYHHRKKSIS